MLIDATPSTFSAIVMVPGRTDLRKSIDGLVNVLLYTYDVNPYLMENVLFLFIGNAKYKIKGLVGRFTWKTDPQCGLQELSYEQFSHLMKYGTTE